MEEGVHYRVSYISYNTWEEIDPPVEVGSYGIYIEGIPSGGYGGGMSWGFDIYDPFDFSSVGVSLYDTHYLYTGSRIEPEPQVWHRHAEGNLVEGKDYILSYENPLGSPDEVVEAFVTVTPIGSYHGDAVRLAYTISPYIDLANVISENARNVSIEWLGSSRGYYGEPNLTILSDGGYITPSVSLEVGNVELMAGKDYEVSYVNENRESVVPKEPGNYEIVVSALEGGRCIGELRISMEVVASFSMDEVEIHPRQSYEWIDDDYYRLTPDSAENLTWDIYLSGSISRFDPIEGYDYEVSTSYDETTECYIAEYTGMGRFEGTRIVRYEISESEVAAEKTLPESSWYINGLYYRDDTTVAVSLSGKVWQPSIYHYELTYGIDYRVAGYVTLEGEALTKVEPGAVGILVEGMGSYEGSSIILEAQAVLADDEASVKLATAINLEDTASFYVASPRIMKNGRVVDYAWPKNSLEDPAIYVSGIDVSWNLVEGIHYTVQLVRDEAAGTLTVTATAIEGSGFKGSATKTIKLMDAVDISGAYLEVDDFYDYPQGESHFPDYAIGIWNEPEQQFSPFEEGVDYNVALYDSQGCEVDSFTGSGTYTLTFTGIGNWCGTVSKTISVREYALGELPLSRASISMSPWQYLYTGEAIEPELEVVCYGRTLQEGVDYSVEYRNNVNAGTALVIITATESGVCCGSLTASFEILDSFDLSMAELRYYSEETGEYEYLGANWPEVLFDGSAAELDVKVFDWLDAYTCIEVDESCYDIEYGSNEEPGIAWVRVTGKNGYEGELSGNFIVKLPPLSEGWNQLGDNTYYCEDGVVATGERLIDGSWRYFDEETGVMATGLTELPDGRKVFYGEDGAMQKGEVLLADGWHLFDFMSGEMRTGLVVMPEHDGRTLYYDESGVMLKGEVLLADGWHFFDFMTGQMQTGLVHMPEHDGRTLYFDESGVMQKGWVEVDGRWLCFSEFNGSLVSGLLTQPNGTTVFYNNDGSLAKGELLVDGEWRYFDEETGVMATGLTELPDGRKVFYGEDGAMQKGEVLLADGWHLFDFMSGEMRTGLVVMPEHDGRTLYYDESGVMLKGEVLLADGWHFFDFMTGQMQTGLVHMPEHDGRTLYFDGSGVMQKGWVEADGVTRYFDPGNGDMATGYVYIDGTRHYFDLETGEMVY